MAVSHAVEECKGSTSLKADHHGLEAIVGETPTMAVRIGDVEVECFIDTGSAVSFITESFYKEKLEPGGGVVQSIGGMLKLTAANGLEIPYLGVLELDLDIEGLTLTKCGVLVLKDTPAVTEHRKRVPGLMGTNVLARIPKFAEVIEL
jgi:hypothetical protein